MADPLAGEKTYLKENQEKLAAQYPGKYLLVREGGVHGAFETYEQGVSAGVRMFGAGPFLVRSVLHPEDSKAPRIPALSVGVPLVAHS